MTGPKQHGRFGKDRHFELVKKALIHIIDRYWETFGVIQVENASIDMHASLTSRTDLDLTWHDAGHYTLHPDILVSIKQSEPPTGRALPDAKNSKVILVECETSQNGLLKDELRLTAYKLLRLRQPDKNKMMMYIALPSELKGKIEKPECFNDLLFFGLQTENGAEK